MFVKPGQCSASETSLCFDIYGYGSEFLEMKFVCYFISSENIKLIHFVHQVMFLPNLIYLLTCWLLVLLFLWCISLQDFEIWFSIYVLYTDYLCCQWWYYRYVLWCSRLCLADYQLCSYCKLFGIYIYPLLPFHIM